MAVLTDPISDFLTRFKVPRVMSGLGISILSTSKGVMSGGSAKKQNLGGELLANVW